ncbi:MAG: Maf family protein [Spirochaetaceae bacterium]|jgi:septum formation protein|nr:Maf family protein [Spirochaetaceae bacterium]
MEPFILASGSLRRQDFFKLLGIPFTIVVPGVDEKAEPGIAPGEQAEKLALKKVEAVIGLLSGRSPPWILGADTVVSLEGELFGKPRDRDDAAAMLKKLRGREHQVYTAMVLCNGRTRVMDTRSSSSTVRFAGISDAEIEWYLDTGEWQGVAGAYRIQGLAGCFVSRVEGSYSSIVGLPIQQFYLMLRENGYPYGAALPMTSS